MAVQFAACILLIAGTLVVQGQTRFLMDHDLGFDQEMIITMPIFIQDRSRKPDYGQHLSYRWRTMKSEVLKHPNVIAASAYTNSPGTMTGLGKSTVLADGKRDRIALIRSDADYLDLFVIDLTRGRNFNKALPVRALTHGKKGREFMLNESAVRYFGWDDPATGGPIGKPFDLRSGGWEPNGSVVGVFEDFHARDLKQPVGPLAMIYSVHILGTLAVKVKPDGIDETLAFLGKFWDRHLPERPFHYAFLDEQIDRSYKREQQTATLINDFSILGILLGCMGIFGLTSFAVERRVKEVGIRKSLGATVTDIVYRLSRESVSVLLVANIIAWPLGFYLLQDWLNQFVYRIDLHVSYFMIAGGSAALIALITVALQAVPAARANPVDSLRNE